MPVQDNFLGLADAARRKRVHYQTVRRAISRGDLKAAKVGGGVVIALEDLDRWQPKYKHVPSMYRHDPSPVLDQGQDSLPGDVLPSKECP